MTISISSLNSGATGTGIGLAYKLVDDNEIDTTNIDNRAFKTSRGS
jgi:hypothetical protein